MASTEDRLNEQMPSAQPGSGERPKSSSRKSVVDVLLTQGTLTPQQLATAQSKHKELNDPRLSIETLLMRLGYATEEDITRARAGSLGIGYASPDMFSPQADIGTEVLATIPGATAHKMLLLPIGRSEDGKSLRVVSSHWTQSSYDAAAKLATEVGLRVEPLLGSDRTLKASLRFYYPNVAPEAPAPRAAVPVVLDPQSLAVGRAGGSAFKPSDVLSVADISKPLPSTAAPIDPNNDADIDVQEFAVDQPIIIQFVNRIISDAISKRASDIHFEPKRDRLEIRYRVDGALHTVDEVPKSFQSACVSRIKVMGEMNIAERRVPQDGRIAVNMSRRRIDLRVSTLPCQFGEAAVLRILDRTSIDLNLDTLGFSQRNLRTLRGIIVKPHGIFLATGPTGSGKTTTLYSSLMSIRSPDINIITVEDPIEYDLEGVRQSSINEKAGQSFAGQLRAILRQDPDVIYVGEIRDPETAEIAFRAALTGHLVFSTLHCNDAPGAITRLLNMGVDPFLIASSVIGIMAQRLVRKVCPECACRYEPKPEDFLALGIDPKSDESQNATFLHGIGCSLCDKTGYFGRYGVHELMVMDDRVRQMTIDREPSTKIRTTAIASGHNPMVPMRRDGAEKVMSGITTFLEVQRRVYISDEE